MKTTMQSLRLFLLIIISTLTFISCSNEEKVLTDEQEANATSMLRPALPPPTPGELRGLYDAKFNNGVEFNLLFEYGNYVSYGNSTIYDMTSQPGTRVPYVYVGAGVETYQFSCTISGVVYNFRFTYDNFSAKFNGTYGTGVSYVNEGTFNGKKHITGASGLSFLKGYWLGTYSGMFDYLMVFEEDGKITAGSGGDFYYNSVAGKGLYELYGNTVIGYYVYPNGYKYTFKGDCDFASKTITGTWGHGDSNSDGGNFTLQAQNYY
jgi:hypothetical protein